MKTIWILMCGPTSISAWTKEWQAIEAKAWSNVNCPLAGHTIQKVNLHD